MSSLSSQRCLNRQSVYPSFPNDVNFVSSLRLSEILSILERNLPACSICKRKQKNHYCMQPECRKKKLLCINCDIKSIKGEHYLHDFTYLIPLFSENVFHNFYRLKDNFQVFHNCVLEQIEKINKYLEKMHIIKGISFNQLKDLDQSEKKGRYDYFEEKLKKYMNDLREETKSEQIQQPQLHLMKLRIDEIFENINFLTQEECQKKEYKMRNELMEQIEKLSWLQNPQKVLTKLLKQNEMSMNLTQLLDDQPSDVFVSSRKKITINEIDSFFRNYNQLFTQNLQHHRVQVKIEPELLSRPKFYQAFIYHFRQCEKLLIDNANITHLKTPLNFRKLKELQFNCNVQTDSINNTRIQNQNSDLQSFTIRKFRQQDIKILKYITGPCKNLTTLHLQFYNKSDLSHSRQLVQYLTQQSEKNLTKFVIKVRTQNQVKRLYGYLTKFHRQAPDPTICLSKAILQLLKNNPNLTKVSIEGIRGLDSQKILQNLFQMKFLLNYRIYYENIDLMAELDNQMNKVLEMKTQKKRRILASLTKMTKDKHYPGQILHTIGQQFLI